MGHDKGLRTIWAIAIMLLALMIAVSEASAQGLNPIVLSGRVDPAQVKPGQKAKILITAKIEPTWHLYSLTQPPGGPRPTRITLEDGMPMTIDGPVQQPKPTIAPDPNFSMPGQPPFMTETFEREAVFTVPVKFADNAPEGPQKFIVKVYFQACDDHQCLPPRTKRVEIDGLITSTALAMPLDPSKMAKLMATPTPLPTASTESTPADVNSGSTETSVASTAADAGEDEDLARDLKRRGLLNYILFAISVGLLSLLTPCVFPMIPITVSFFTKREHRTTGDAIKQALIYCFGIIFTFTGLGMAMTLIAGPAGINRLAASPWMNLFLTTLFVVFALNLFGMFEIRLPTGLITKLDSKTQSGTTAATLLMGLTFTLTSFTCTAAFVGTVLVAVTQGEWFWPAVGMLAFSTAFAFPFFLLALFPKWLQSMPKSGGWLNSVKVVMGFLELGAAFKFLSNVDLVWGWNTVSRNLVIAAWIAISVVTAVYLLGKFLLPHDTPVQRLGVARMLSATFFLGLAFYFLTGLFGGNLGEWEAMLPPPQTVSANAPSSVGSSHGTWMTGYDEALKKGKSDNKPVFLNFTGVTCTNCRWMESNMFTDQEIRRELENFVLAELYTDRETLEDEKNSQLQADKFQTVALPLYAIVDSDGTILAKFPGLTRDKQEFLAFLKRGAGRFQPLAASGE